MSPELDTAVFDYLVEERAVGRPVSNKDLRHKALELSQSGNFTVTVPSTFKASAMWLKRWKRRRGVSLRCSTSDAQKVPSDYENVLHGFRESIIQSHLKHSLSPSQIVNMDQTMCHFDMVPSRTNDIIGTRSVRISSTKATKKGFTVALAASGSGEKLPAMIIFKERGGQLGPRVKQSLVIPSNVRVNASKNGWMTAELYHWWLQHIYKPMTSSRSCHHLLLVDNYRPHLTPQSQEIVHKCDSDLIFIPPGCTPLVQPMDVSVNRPFKSRMEELWVAWFRHHTATTPSGNPKQPTRQNAIDWVSTAWADIPQSIIEESFILCGITADVDGTDNDRMFCHVPKVSGR